MLLTRDEETNEIVRTLIDKKKRKKVTALKRAIQESRKIRKQKQEERKRIRKLAQHKADAQDSQYETIYETDYKNEDDADEIE